MKQLTHLSLFSGIGGIDIAAHWSGFETVQFVERDEFCQKVLAKNFPGVPIHGDIATFDGAKCIQSLKEVAPSEAPLKIDLVSAGFP